MREHMTEAARREVIRLIYEQKQKLLEELLQTPYLLKSNKQDQQQRNLNREDIEQWLEILNGEAYKTERLEVSFAVVGTMKAGKSTTINAIVGTEVLPNRNQPMTTLPTVIRHCPGKREPELTFPNPGPFNEIIDKLKEELQLKKQAQELDSMAFCSTEDGRRLIGRILDGSLGHIRRTYTGIEEIYFFLKSVNDIWRLASSEDIAIDMDQYLDEYDEIHEFPAIDIEFFHLRDQQSEQNQGQFTLIDTPGPNESGQPFLKHIMQEQLAKASAVLAVLDYTQLNAEADAEVRKALEQVAGVNDHRLFVLINKFDQKDRNGMDAEALKAYVVKNLFAGSVEQEQVHPVSSMYGYLANRALYELSAAGRLPDYCLHPWVEDFGRLALGACWETEIEDAEEVEYRALKLWRNSLFDSPLTEVIKKGSENAALISLKSAVAKMLDFDKKIMEGLQVRQTALNTDIKIVEEHIKCLEQDVRLVKAARDGARETIAESIGVLQLRISELFTVCEEAAKKEVQAIFQSEQGNNWITKRLHGFVGTNAKARSISLEFDPKGYNDFETEAEAKQFLNRLIEAVATDMEPKLDEMQQLAQRTVDEMSGGIWRGVNNRLTQVLKAAEQRLHEAFAVSLDFPKPQVRPVTVNFAALREAAVKEDKVTKTGTRRERRWYTLWCHKHETTYQYQERIYRIYTLDIAQQLQKLLEQDHRQIKDAVEAYIRHEFSKAIHGYFTEIANYLERFKGDLLDAKRDQELENDRLEKLQSAMSLLLRAAVNHRKEVQGIAEGLPEDESKQEFVKTAG